MITRLDVHNFKSWGAIEKMELGSITGLFSSNSSGKTSTLQLLLMLKQTVESSDPSQVLNFGDAFMKLVWQNQANPLYGEQVSISPINEFSFEEFPKDVDLEKFHWKDRRFVAVAITNENNPVVLNAPDSDWWHFREASERNSIRINFLCPQHMPE